MKILLSIIKLLVIAILLLPIGCGKQDGSQMKDEEKLSSQVEQWLEAVSKGQVETALKLADRICGDVDSPSISTNIAGLCRDNGIRPEFINAKFNRWDFQYWRHAIFFKRLARSITDNAKVKNSDDVISKLFSAVHERIKPVDPPKGSILWPYTIWHLKKGLCDRQAWVLCELAYQLGYETQIVYLRNPKTLVSPHTICELRKGDKVWLADPYSGKLLSNMSVAELAADSKMKAATWPDRTDWQEAINKSAYWLPSYPQDYCPRNQALRSKLEQVMGDNYPRFGEPPVDRLKKYLSLTTKNDRRFSYGLWFYPFRLLSAEMLKVTMNRNRKNRESDHLKK